MLLKRSGLLLSLALNLGAVVFIDQAATADDHRAPRVVLLSEGSRQRGDLLISVWIRPDDPPFCVATRLVDLPEYPRGIDYTHGQLLTIRLRKAGPPLEAEILAWRRVNREGFPKGDPTEVISLLTPHFADGHLAAWDAILALPAWTRYYVHASFTWRDEEGCVPEPDPGSQHATWTFFLVTPAPEPAVMV